MDKIKQQYHVTESVNGNWSYHLSKLGVNSISICGVNTMMCSLRISQWGYRGHLNEKYCEKCWDLAHVNEVSGNIDR